MPHNERPKVGQKVTLCGHCGRKIDADQKHFRIENLFLHYGCYFIYRRVHRNGDRVA